MPGLNYPQRVHLAKTFAKHRRARSPHAIGVLAFTDNVADSRGFITTGSRRYDIAKGADLAATIAALAAAITADQSAVVTVVPPAEDDDGTTLTVAAKRGGYGGGFLPVSTNANAVSAWSGTTLTYTMVE